MRAALAVLAALAVGCGTASPIRVEYEPGEAGPLGGAHPKLVAVQLEPRSYGRSCYTLDVEPDGTVAIVIAVDATTDWIGVRALPAIVPSIVEAALTTALTVVGAPFELLMKVIGAPTSEPPKLEAPSPLSACSALLED